ncbi:MAG: hypothetical protein KAH93_03850 [Candidatus Aenigmarchaeota archaeon]|nr:hypothetical protein [Candidatus Aenigmarchaeota archaeon]
MDPLLIGSANILLLIYLLLARHPKPLKLKPYSPSETSNLLEIRKAILK